MNIAIIPARGGSKRIPRKNIKLFQGLPVIAYAIETARESGLFDDVFVSTDDKEIAEIALSSGATVPWLRSNELSDDFTTTLKVMQDAVKKLATDLNTLENVCCIYPVTPFLKPKFLSQGLKILKNGDWNYVVSVSEAKTAPERSLSVGKDNEIIMRFPEYETTRTQDIPPAYHDAGQFYWGKKSAWESALPLFTSKSAILELPREYALDVDTLDDWDYAERLFNTFGKDPN
jgi:N-acylneuraminate cytidylyltransferase